MTSGLNTQTSFSQKNSSCVAQQNIIVQNTYVKRIRQHGQREFILEMWSSLPS